ncbi:ABC transporter permease [Bacillus sp. IB182487]|uniref:ABC transporter permease n=2 Tax=Metabacillus arenae TaxID=2771434 RepID=A0A926NLL1_9BACI|nr:ABC transporter permease [Metabacillus arenae]MBD1380277.1 ABC transporter permease [Metabacillus arenae]
MMTAFFEVPDWLIPRPSAILLEGIQSFGDFRHHIFSTIRLTLVGFTIGTSIGIVLSILLHLLPKIKDMLYPLLILSQNVPIIVLAPLLVIWFGFGLLPKVIVISLVCFFPVVISALDGFRQTPSEWKHYVKMMGASRSQLFWKLEMPYALPAIFSGLKISATYSVMGAVISEWLGAKSGIGVYMTLASSSFRTDRVFVAILTIMIVSLLFFALIVYLERLFIKGRKKGESNR